MENYTLTETEQRLLLLAGEAWDRKVEAQAELRERGAVVTDRFGQPKENPAAKLERESMTSFRATVKQLNLAGADPDELTVP